MNTNLPPSADILRKRIEAAKDRGLDKVKKAAEGTVERFNCYIEAMVKEPEKYTTHTLFSEQMPMWAYHRNGYDDFISILRSMLTPLGYRVELSHDGGGMYSTVVIRWDIPKKSVQRGMLNPHGEDYPEPMIRDASLLRG